MRWNALFGLARLVARDALFFFGRSLSGVGESANAPRRIACKTASRFLVFVLVRFLFSQRKHLMSRNRGKPKAKLSDLSREPLTIEESHALTAALSADAHPITAAVLGSSSVEHELELSLRKRIPRRDETLWKVLTADVGPLSSFHRKIEMAYALKIVDEKTRNDLHIVRNVRNAFAHARRLMDFNHPLVVKELRSAKALFKKDTKDTRSMPMRRIYQSAFLILCLRLTLKLIKKRTGRIKTSAYARLLGGVPMLGTGNPGLTPKQLGAALLAGPNQPKYPQPLGWLLGLGAEPSIKGK